VDADALLRPGLLADRVIALGGGTALAAGLAGLGARTVALSPSLDEQAAAAEVAAALAAHGDVDVLLHDLRPGFAREAGAEGFRTALDGAWIAARAVATAAFIPDERGGRIAFVAPAPAPADPHAAGARAAVENLARTLSIEWSRFGVRTVAITPGTATSDGELTALAAYLASPAGDYFSGCVLALGGV
jgi:citronellol/citronellal dehydrogenase